MNVLYIANALPYDQIRHAGGQTFYFYVNQLVQTKRADIKVIGICKENEVEKLNRQSDKLMFYPVISRGSFFTNLKRVAFDAVGLLFPRKACGQSFYKTWAILKNASAIRDSGFVPDVIFLEWTNCILMVQEIKKIFPESKVVASAHDVSFLAMWRKWKNSPEDQKERRKKEYEDFKRRELEAFSRCDVIMPHNEKDRQLLLDEKIPEDKLKVLTPYFHDMTQIHRKALNHDVLFWGAMYRPENEEAVLWFAENVMPLLQDTDIRFVIAGNKPSERVKKLAGCRIVVTGFVENEIPLFEQSMCFVSPLIHGAGIKVKVIEALSAGIPVLTNDVGIEGIPASDRVDYYHCTTPEEYADVIRNILDGKVDAEQMLHNQRKLIEEHFDLQKGSSSYLEMIRRLAGQK